MRFRAKRRPLVPEDREALDKMNFEFANELGIQFNDEYNGNKFSKLNIYIGGMITRKAVADF